LKALNDLAKGKKEMLEELKLQNRDTSIHREFLFGEASGASQQYDHPPPTTHPPTFRGPTKTMLSTFLP